MNADANPLLRLGTQPDFAAIRPEHVGPALDVLLADAEAALERAVGPGTLPDYDTVSLLLDVPVERLRTAWGLVGHLQSVADSPAWRQAQSANLPRIVDFSTRLGSDARLYARYKTIAAGQDAVLTPARRKALADALREFVLGGAELQGAARARHAVIQDRLATLSQRFGDNVLDATDAYALFVPEAELAGVPADVVAAARAAAEADGRSGCKLTLKAPCYVPVLTHASNRTLRETLFRAYNTRCSEFGSAEQDNRDTVRELLELRHEEARLLGYTSYANSALVGRMAGSALQVAGFVRDLAARARPQAERELAELRAFASEHLGLDSLQAWDRAYVAEQLKQQRYAFSSEAVRQYFTAPRVLQGLFELVEALFGVSIREETAPAWHPSVRHYRIRRGEREVATFFLDTEARTGKRGGAWMDFYRSRWQRPDGALQQPVAYLVCNFAPPVDGKPSLLSHENVITLFHEFGHGLHHMLTQAEDLAVSGIAGVEDDATELPSQFMENFCWEWQVLQRLTAHVDTGEHLPRELFERMTRARSYLTATALLRQCEYALFDMRVHSEPDTSGRVQAVADAVTAELQPEPWPDFMRGPLTFTHLFDGGYAAGYYGYSWALVLAADAYSAFEEAGVVDAATGRRFREEVLEVGGTRPALESFKAFRGREPQIDALMRHLGIGQPAAVEPAQATG
jgi:oligopeptidase A